ncbi:Protein NLRC5 [Exaiptasia diaphana]|nr:Protein NLRC5 [Exaiptasia diaphana]
MELYSKKLKKTILKQTELELQPKGIIQSMKTDDIFTNLIVHHGKKRCPELLPQQIQRPHGYHPDRKTLTEIKQCSEIFVDEDEKDTTVKRILLSGEPGVGKTLFSQKLLRDLSTNSISLPEIKFTYLITFRQLNNFSNEETLNLRELLNLCPLLNDGTMIDENVMDYILQHPEQLLIVLDGFDEYKDSNKILGDFESQFPNDSKTKKPVAALLSKLIRKKILADAVIMVTSRPSEANALDQEMHPDHYVEITGFSESEGIRRP